MNRWAQREVNKKVEKPWAKVAKTLVARPQERQEAKRGGAQMGSKETATIAGSQATVQNGARLAKGVELVK